MQDESRFLFDVLSAILLLLTALLGAYFPRYLAFKDDVHVPNASSSVLFHLGNMLSAGVMLSAGFCHLLPDSLHNLAFTGRFPTATFLSALGYIITLLADQMVHLVADHSSRRDDDSEYRYRRLTQKGTPGDSLLGGGPTEPEVSVAGECELHDYSTSMVQHRGAHHTNGHIVDLHLPGDQLPVSTSDNILLGPSAALLASQQHDCHSAHLKVFLPQKPLSFATTVLLAGALCVHSILEGMALGAQQSMKDTEDIMIAIAAHKGLAAYALGASIVESKASATKFWTVVVTFAAATPLGIFLGFGFSEVSGKGGAVMSALASGTFLYVAMMEVIPKELANPSYRFPKMCMLLLGFGLMSLLAVWA